MYIGRLNVLRILYQRIFEEWFTNHTRLLIAALPETRLEMMTAFYIGV